eukprot:TRINITY_DN4657_c0_g1_i2.p1 TRINITY_DN4657_c0_g1~~TRINITY_DN4657_c0_g1_i2.p1  ORF type:complete len:626 (-),score=144.64 TRINITY_DN4657_c0_g1_i2:79-1680(-)
MAVKHEFGAALDALLQPERERYCHIKKAAHRLSVLEELITTERHYLEDLRLLVNVWQIEIAKTSVLTQQETNLVFDRLPQMVVLSSELLEDLVQIQTAPSHEQLVGSCFLKRLPFFRLYIEFTLRQAQAATSEILLNAKKHSKLAALLMKMLEKPELKGLGLEDYLIKPAQRIMKYPLLIKDLIENTEHAHPDYGNLVQALNEMEQLLTDINNEKKKWETVQLLSKLQPNMAWRKDAYDLLSSNCQLLCHGQMEIVVVSSDGADKGDEAYMFDACTLICRARAGKWDEMALFLTDDISFEQDPNSATFVMRSKSRTDNFAIFHPPDKLERQRWLSVFTQARKLHTERPKKLVCGGTPDQARKSHKKFSAFKPKRLSVKSEEGEQMLHRTSSAVDLLDLQHAPLRDAAPTLTPRGQQSTSMQRPPLGTFPPNIPPPCGPSPPSPPLPLSSSPEAFDAPMNIPPPSSPSPSPLSSPTESPPAISIPPPPSGPMVRAVSDTFFYLGDSSTKQCAACGQKWTRGLLCPNCGKSSITL